MKTYEQSTGNNAIKIAKICSELKDYAKHNNVEIILCPQLIDIKDVIENKVETYAQHIDNYDFGAHTGYQIAPSMKKIGVKGTLINHSEHTLPLKEIQKTIENAKKYKLVTCVCARNNKEVEKIKELGPDMIAVEPKELIGGDISISTSKPELISDSVKTAGNIELLVGAGIKNSNDVKKAVELGAKGILVASGVVKAKNIKNAIKDLIDGFR